MVVCTTPVTASGKVVQTLMGHSDIETTMNIYTKVHGDFLMREYMEKVWSKE